MRDPDFVMWSEFVAFFSAYPYLLSFLPGVMNGIVGRVKATRDDDEGWIGGNLLFGFILAPFVSIVFTDQGRNPETLIHYFSFGIATVAAFWLPPRIQFAYRYILAKFGNIEMMVRLRMWDDLVRMGAPAVPVLVREKNWDDIVRIGKPAVHFLVAAWQARSGDGYGLSRVLYKLGWSPKEQDQRILFFLDAELWYELVRMGPSAIPALERELEKMESYSCFEKYNQVADALFALGVAEIRIYEYVPQQGNDEMSYYEDIYGSLGDSCQNGMPAGQQLVFIPRSPDYVPAHWRKISRLPERIP